MNVRALEARLRRVEGGRRDQPEAWVERYLRAHPDSGMLVRSAAPGHEPWWLLELSTDAIRRLGAVWRAGGPDPTREAWRVVVEHVQTILPVLNEYLATEGRNPLPPEQEDRDLARVWSLATGAWPAPGPGNAVRGL